MALKNNRNGSNYDHDDGDDDEKNENDDHCCHFLDLLYQVSFTAFWHPSQI